MFEKSLYDLIRGLRNHKGNEREYIQNSLRECRSEIRGSDIDLKATALLKLVYLEMFGHDMSWASFNVLEVMSSSKYLQKRVGYLGAVQSFRPDTEVLMLATNLLKKDITSASITTISLPLVTMPHIITPSLAMSLLGDLLLRLTHSSPSIRKKTIVTLYRLALVYPETLRPAWPKIKDILMDDNEDPSVIAAVINVVCELGWRRPQDFLPLAPRLFDLLVDGGNNWMAIKIIKLFATLTPLEPRLIKKLLPPLANLIRTTPAMSLLYECIHGIIQGGIFETTDEFSERDEVARLCVSKLRGMIVVEGDPNLKYVALLSFNKIVVSHPYLVSIHQDVIMNCIDDPDLSIRLQALQLGSGMINTDNLVSVVDRLLIQLRNTPLEGSKSECPSRDGNQAIEPAADYENEDPEKTLQPDKSDPTDTLPLPDEYRATVIQQVLHMCSRNTYANIVDFEWYIDVLLKLATVMPLAPLNNTHLHSGLAIEPFDDGIAVAIGAELRNVAVRVVSVRMQAVRAACLLLTSEWSQSTIPRGGSGWQDLLGFAAWIAGEYSSLLPDRHGTLATLLLPPSQELPSTILCAYLQAIPKVLASIFVSETMKWNAQCQTMTSLLIARVIHFLEPLTTNPNLEVQERSVELLELMRLSIEAAVGHDLQDSYGPLILSRALPALFNGLEMKPVALSAQSKVPLPSGINLDTPLNKELFTLLEKVEQDPLQRPEVAEFENLYHNRLSAVRLEIEAEPISDMNHSISHQDMEQHPGPKNSSDTYDKRIEKNKSDPFYISTYQVDSSSISTPFHDILQKTNGPDLDIEAIPIMKLDLGRRVHNAALSENEGSAPEHSQHQQVHVMAEETIGVENPKIERQFTAPGHRARAIRDKTHRGLLQFDSSGIGDFSLDPEKKSKRQEEGEMVKALAEVEKLRMEMRRASERVRVSNDISLDGTLVKKKKKKKKKKDKDEDKEHLSKPTMEQERLEDDAHSLSPNTATESTKKKNKKKESKWPSSIGNEN